MKYLILALSMLMSITMMAQEEHEVIVDLSNPSQRVKLEVGVNKGDLIIKGTARKNVLVRYKNESSSKLKLHDGGNGLKKIVGATNGIEITEEDNYIEIHNQNWNDKISIYIEVPFETDLEAGTMMEGVLEVNNVSGEMELENANGPVKATNVSGVVQANSFNGSVTVDFKKITPNAAMSFVSYNGKVDVSLPTATKFSVKAQTDHGDVYTGFDMKMEAKKSKQKENGKTIYTDSWIRGAVNGGGPEFTFKTFHGDVYIRSK
jgi:ribosome-associated translation inhibitor RaiA